MSFQIVDKKIKNINYFKLKTFRQKFSIIVIEQSKGD